MQIKRHWFETLASSYPYCMTSDVSVIHGSTLASAGTYYFFLKYWTLWKTWRLKSDHAKTEKCCLYFTLKNNFESISLERDGPVASLMVIKSRSFMLVDIEEDQGVLAKCNRHIDWKEMDETNLIVELEILSYL